MFKYHNDLIGFILLTHTKPLQIYRLIDKLNIVFNLMNLIGLHLSCYIFYQIVVAGNGRKDYHLTVINYHSNKSAYK